jgi:hypothetical protein
MLCIASVTNSVKVDPTIYECIYQGVFEIIYSRKKYTLK